MKVSLLSGFLLFFQLAYTQYDFSAVEKKLEASKKELGGDAFVMIYKDGKIVYQKGIGEFQVKTQAPIAFASQWLTAALVMTFVDEGRLSLDDKVSKFLPLFSVCLYSQNFIYFSVNPKIFSSRGCCRWLHFTLSCLRQPK